MTVESAKKIINHDIQNDLNQNWIIWRNLSTKWTKNRRQNPIFLSFDVRWPAKEMISSGLNNIEKQNGWRFKFIVSNTQFPIRLDILRRW